MPSAVLGDDYLAAGALIEARIRDEVPSIKRVEELATLYEALDSDDIGRLTSGQMPAAFVGYDGDVPGDRAGGGSSQVIAQRYMVVLAVANVRRADTGKGVVQSAGQLLVGLVRGLSGWTPEGFTELMRQAAPRPGFRAGVGFYPLMYTTQMVVEGHDED